MSIWSKLLTLPGRHLTGSLMLRATARPRLPNLPLQHARWLAASCDTAQRRIKIKLVSATAETNEKYIERNVRMGRALSPALSIYKPQITSMLSISLRISGLALTCYAWLLGLVGLLSSHDLQDILEVVESLAESLHHYLIIAAKYIIGLPLVFHYVNGLRNLIWLTGAFLTKPQIYITGYITIVATIILTFLLAILEPDEDETDELGEAYTA